jgi:hypothetical protein
MLQAPVVNVHGTDYRLDALPDPADFRDRLFVPTLVDVPLYIDLEDYEAWNVPILDQGTEGSCTGFALATVAHYLLRTRAVVPATELVSARMLYEMAKRYDEWEGEEYEGSSTRGAIKGWHKHGVCSAELWDYSEGERDRALTDARAKDALLRPLGAYFRVNHRDLTAMHAALAEVGVLCASAKIHEGWINPHPQSGLITSSAPLMQGHAFAIVGYSRQGFWVQSSWGTQWGKGGYALLTYDDWLLHGMDVWVVRLGVPVEVTRPLAKAQFFPATTDDQRALGLERMRSHVVRVNEEGRLSPHGSYATFEDDVARIFEQDIPAITAEWPVKRLLLYAGGGLVPEDDDVTRMSRTGALLLEQQIYPLAFIWNTGFLAVVRTLVAAAMARVAPEGPEPYPTASFMQPRLDAALEPKVRELAGRLLWKNVKDYGYRATKNEQGALRIVMEHLQRFTESFPDAEIHLLAHSAGSIFLAPFVQYMTASTDDKIEQGPMRGRSGCGVCLTSATLWAPAIRTDLFAETYRPAINSGMIKHFALYTLTDQVERNDCCVGPYSKSLLYLISNALEEVAHVPERRPHGQPLLGMEYFVNNDPDLLALFEQENAAWVLSPNDHAEQSINGARAQSHVRFGEPVTLLSTARRILDS